MVRVQFPIGCYGTYVAKCLYYHTSLGSGPKPDFVFDDVGSSHDFRSILSTTEVISVSHSFEKSDIDDKIVVLVPSVTNYLDYYNNQYAKEARKDIWSFIFSHFQQEHLQEKLGVMWEYSGDIYHTPRWILRELLSFCIDDFLSASYGADKDHGKDVLLIECRDLFMDFYLLIENISTSLGLTITSTKEEILAIHEKFIDAQSYHNSQNRCVEWVESVYSNVKKQSPCQTIFDECYIQSRLRKNGWLLKCQDLDSFPSTNLELQHLLYKE
jgi:hypothetical protein